MAKPKVFKAKWNSTATAAEMEMCGVYKILNVNTGKFYIGSTGISFSHRWSQHVRRLRNGNHFNRHLSASWEKHRESAFVFSIVEVTRPEWAVAYEQVFLDCWRPWDCKYGYNINTDAATSIGRKHTPEARKAISERAKLQFSNPEVRKTVSERQKIIRGTPEARKAQSERSKAMLGTPEARKAHGERMKIRLSTPEARQAITERSKSMWADPIRKSLRIAKSNATRLSNRISKESAGLLETPRPASVESPQAITGKGDKNGQ